MASMLNKYFSSVFNATCACGDANTNYINTNDLTSSEHTLQNVEIITEEVLNNMKTNESSRPDNVYPLIIKETTKKS